jgi:predicted small lipoprotein YifL
MQAGPLLRSSAVALAVIALVAVLAGCGKKDELSPSVSTPNPAATDRPSKGTAPAPGVTSGTTAPPVRSPATTGRPPSTETGAAGTTATSETTAESASTSSTAAP